MEESLEYALGEQQHLAGCTTGRQCPMRFCRVGQREAPVNPHFERAGGRPAEHIIGAVDQFGPVEQVVTQRRARQEDRPFGIQHLRMAFSTCGSSGPTAPLACPNSTI